MLSAPKCELCGKAHWSDGYCEVMAWVPEQGLREIAQQKIAQWRALAAQVREDLKGEVFENYDRLDVKRIQLEACAMDLEAALERPRPAPEPPCSVCGGKPLASGRECVCGGRGTEYAEAQGLRERLADLEIALGFYPNVSPTISKAYDEVRAALPPQTGATDRTGKPLRWVVEKCEKDGSRGWYVLLPDTGNYWFAPEKEAAARAFRDKLNGVPPQTGNPPPERAP